MKRAVVYGILSFFLSIDYGKSIDRAELESKFNSYLDQRICSLALQDPLSQIEQMLHQVGEILNRVQITPNNKNIVQKIRDTIKDQKSVKNKRKGQKNLRIKTLLQISYFLNIQPSILLTSENLASHVNLDDLKFRSSLPESNMRALLILINRYLRKKIEDIKSDLPLDLDVPVTNSVLADILGVLESSIFKILYSNMLPSYLQFAQILNTNTGVIDFFKEVESSSEFDRIFNVQNLQSMSEKQNLTLEESQFLRNTSHHIITVMNQRGIEDFEFIKYLTDLKSLS